MCRGQVPACADMTRLTVASRLTPTARLKNLVCANPTSKFGRIECLSLLFVRRCDYESRRAMAGVSASVSVSHCPLH